MKQDNSQMIRLAILAALLLMAAPAVRTARADDGSPTTTIDITSTTLVGGGGDDADDDGVSDGEDNCPAVADPSQDDLDGDGQGDVCDSEDAQLDDDGVVAVKPASGDSSGSLVGKGTFVAGEADDDTVDDSGDITVEVSDSGDMDETVDVSSDDCTESDTGNVSCTTPTAKVKLKRSTGGYRYTVKLKGVSTATAPVAPVTLRIQHGSHKTDRVGHLSSCGQSGTKTVCSN